MEMRRNYKVSIRKTLEKNVEILCEGIFAPVTTNNNKVFKFTPAFELSRVVSRYDLPKSLHKKINDEINEVHQ